jgi:hypothetical protein
MTNDEARRNDKFVSAGRGNQHARRARYPDVGAAFVARAEANNEEIGATGFEPATSWSQTTRSTKLSYAPRECVMVITCTAGAHVKSLKATALPS